MDRKETIVWILAILAIFGVLTQITSCAKTLEINMHEARSLCIEKGGEWGPVRGDDVDYTCYLK